MSKKQSSRKAKTTDEKRPIGRPRKFLNEDLKTKVLNHIANGFSIKKACKAEGVDSAPFWTEVRRDEEFLTQYREAKEAAAILYAEEALEIADESEADSFYDDDGKLVVNYEHIQRAKLRIEQRRWMASRLALRLYGDKQQMEVSGKDGAPILGLVLNKKEDASS